MATNTIQIFHEIPNKCQFILSLSPFALTLQFDRRGKPYRPLPESKITRNKYIQSINERNKNISRRYHKRYSRKEG